MAIKAMAGLFAAIIIQLYILSLLTPNNVEFMIAAVLFQVFVLALLALFYDELDSILNNLKTGEKNEH